MRLGIGGALVSFLVGFATGGLLVFNTLHVKDDASLGEIGGSESGARTEEDSDVDVELSPGQEVGSSSSPADVADWKPSPVVAVAPENRPDTPPVYVDMLGPSYRSVSMEDLHLTFSLEPREDAWAFAVESEIRQYVANNDVAEWAEIEYVECRKSICEVAGYLRGDTTHDAREIIDGISDATWWHQERTSHRVQSYSDGLRRFVVIVTALNFENRVRPPSPVRQ